MHLEMMSGFDSQHFLTTKLPFTDHHIQTQVAGPVINAAVTQQPCAEMDEATLSAELIKLRGVGEFHVLSLYST